MSGFKAVPADADSTKSYQFFRDICQQALDARAKELGKDPVKFDPKKLNSLNRQDGDGEFSLVYEEPSLDFGVTGLVLWRNHEMLIRGGKLSAKDRYLESKPLAGRFVEDAATFTQKIVGKDEFQGAKMEDGIADPRLKGKQDTEAFKFLSKECPTRFAQFLRSRFKVKAGEGPSFDPRFVRIENPVPGDGDYTLRFESRANSFFCEAAVNSTQHFIGIRSGSTYKEENVRPESPRRFHHSCSETKAFLGDDELLDPKGCKDYSEGEQTQSNAAGLAWNLFILGTASYGLYRSYTKPTGWLGRLLRLPVLRNFGWGLATYLGYDSIASNFVDSENPWRKYGSPIAGGVGMIAPELAKTAVAQRVGAAALNSRLATGLFARFAGLRTVGGVASRATVGLALVWGMNKIFQWGVGSDYEASVNQRVTDLIYDENVYKLSGWDLLVIPLAFKGVRASCRFIAPDAMEWAVTKDNADLKEDIYKKDEKDSEAGEDMMRETLPHFLHSANAEDRKEMLKLLGSPVEFSNSENLLVLAIKVKPDEDPLATIKALKPDMSEADTEAFLRKFIAYQVQQVAKGLVFVERPVNNWSREIFTKDGILREGETAPTKLTDRWPPPPVPVATPQ
jgi:hypothetical protein